jgi:dihydrofolate reductase
VAKLSYFTICSLDGYIEDEEGRFDWAEPDYEVHAFANTLSRPVGTHLYGRGMYETMMAWQELGKDPGDPEPIREFAELWRAAEKIVYSKTLDEVTTPLTRLDREFEPGTVRAMADEADRDMSVSGAGLAAEAIRAGIVDELQMIVAPVVVGGGKPALPSGVRWDLELVEGGSFGSGFAFLRYVSSDSGSE